jgi:hypothetical protein
MIELAVFIYFAYIAGLRIQNWKHLVTKSEKTNTYEFDYRQLKNRKDVL